MIIPRMYRIPYIPRPPIAEDLEYHMSGEEEIVERHVKFRRFRPSVKKFKPSPWMLLVTYRSLLYSNVVETYTPNEKNRLSSALNLVVEYSNRAVNACIYDGGSKFSLNEVNIQIKTWFGIPTTENFRVIQDGLQKMHDVITSSEECLIFVDTRKHLTKNKTAEDLPAQVLQSEFVPLMEPTAYEMSPFISGLHIYVDDELIEITNAQLEMAQVIYKNMSIQVLGTDIFTSTLSLVDNERTCMELAKENNNESLKNSGCWSNFVFGFSPVEKESYAYQHIV